MPLEKQVCSLELAQKLKELGAKQESLFYWSKMLEEFEILASPVKIYKYSVLLNAITEIEKDVTDAFSAFTVAELGEMLPMKIIKYDSFNEKDKPFYLECSKSSVQYICGYVYDNHLDDDVTAFTADTEADARAKMLVYLLENGLVTL